jgi:hypothetical protein
MDGYEYCTSIINTASDGSFKTSFYFNASPGVYKVYIYNKAGDYKTSAQFGYYSDSVTPTPTTQVDTPTPVSTPTTQPNNVYVIANYNSENYLKFYGEVSGLDSGIVYLEAFDSKGVSVFNGQTEYNNGRYSLVTYIPLPPGTYTAQVSVEGTTLKASNPFFVKPVVTSTATPTPVFTPTKQPDNVYIIATYRSDTSLEFYGQVSGSTNGIVNIEAFNPNGVSIFKGQANYNAVGYFLLTTYIPLPPGTYTAQVSVEGTTLKASTPFFVKPAVTPTPIPVPPVINGSALEESNVNGWFNSDVTVHFNAFDPNPVHNIISLTSDTILTNEGKDQSVCGTAISSSGYTNKALVSDINIDKTPPEINVSYPAEDAEYLLNQDAASLFSCSDNLSGIETITSTVESGTKLDTTTIGLKKFDIKVTDKAGNVSTKTIKYYVRYDFSGLMNPLCSENSSFKIGRALPLKFTLKDSLGVHIGSTAGKIYVRQLINGVEQNDGEAISTNGSDTFIYDSSTNKYVFIMQTKSLSIGTWRLKIRLDDTSTYSYDITLD